MSHQEILWTLQACWDFVVTFVPVVALGLLTWRVAR